MEQVIGIGEFLISNKESDTLKTYALASCVGITVYSGAKKVAGMAHIALPNPSESEKDNIDRICYYASTGIPFFFRVLCNRYSCKLEEFRAELYGGADSININDRFQIGKRNINAVINELNKLDVKLSKVDVGGLESRTIELSVSTGDIKVNRHPIKI